MMQMGSVGPMLGQAHHFLKFNRGKSEYAEKRYGDEAKRIYGVLNKRLGEAEYLAGDYSIADIATWPWIARYEWQGIDLGALSRLEALVLARSRRAPPCSAAITCRRKSARFRCRRSRARSAAQRADVLRRRAAAAADDAARRVASHSPRVRGELLGAIGAVRARARRRRSRDTRRAARANARESRASAGIDRRDGAVHHGDGVRRERQQRVEARRRAARAESRSRRARRPAPTRQLTPSQTGRPDACSPRRTRAAHAASLASSRAHQRSTPASASVSASSRYAALSARSSG